MTPLLLVAALVAADAAPRLLVLPAEAVGIEPALVDDIVSALRAEATARRFDLLSAEAERRLRPAAARCGEDLRCLAEVGAQAAATWVIVFGLGDTGGAVVVAGSRIEVAAAHRDAFSSSRLRRGQVGALAIAETLGAELLPPPFTPPPPIVEAPPPPAPPPAPVAAPAPAPEATGALAPGPGPIQARTYAVGATAGALLLASGILGIVALDAFSRLPLADPVARPGLEDRQRWLNGAADASGAAGLAAAAVAVVLFFLDRAAEPGSPEP